MCSYSSAVSSNALFYALTRFWLIMKENHLSKQRWIEEFEGSSVSELCASRSSVLKVEDPTQDSIPEVDSRSFVDSTQVTISKSSTSTSFGIY
ncbi:hypothetical protein Mgra_00001687 [Meloidogyne graminicola]|uniref:Uncharacterized protein n=1 Tax=Meloidogyne graminicola TaxID=189291 RepID=A0A8T0A045_9BILA|nr:hypothetical protein Mgra_00001687 [Meloidogyne graminicola]